MKYKKCKIKIEFQAENDEEIKRVLLRFDQSVAHLTRCFDVTATIDYPDKFNPYAKP